MFSCEYCEIFKNSFFYRTPPKAAFVSKNFLYSGLTLDFERSLHYPLSLIPSSIATPDGGNTVTAKSKFMDAIKNSCRQPPKTPRSKINIDDPKLSVTAIDLIAAFRIMIEVPQKYIDLKQKLLG